MSTSHPNLGKYQLLEEIGRGGMGAVYKGYDPYLDRTVAIKLLAPHLVWETGFVERFLREARAAARLQHPNIIPIFDVGQDGDRYYFVMAFLPGESLRQRVAQKGRLALAEALPILRQLADALDYAHAEGLVHRDVKPANVMFDKRGQAILTDFGIVKAAQETKLTGTGAAIGTPQYMAPEQVEGKPVSARTDQYALGIIAFELLTGRVPFDADTVTAILHMQVYDPPPSICRLCPDVPRGVEGVVNHALAKLPDKRYALCSEFVRALEQAAAQPAPKPKPRPREQPKPQPQPAPPVTPLPLSALREEARRAPQPAELVQGILRKPLPLLLFGISLLAVGVMVVVALTVLNRGGAATLPTAVVKQPVTAIHTSTPPTPTPLAVLGTSTPQPAASKTTIPSLTPTFSLPVLEGTPAPQPVVAILPENAAQVTQLARWGKGTIEQIAWSPDGKQLAGASSIGIYFYAAQTLQEIGFIETDAQIKSVTFSPDGEMLASGAWDGTVCLWRVSDGALLRTLEGHTGRNVTSVAFSSDGKTIASGSGNAVHLWRVSDGALLHTLEEQNTVDTVNSVAFSPDGKTLASGSWNGAVRLWRVSDGTMLRTLANAKYTFSVGSVAFSPDGKLLASAGSDATVRLWQVSNGALLRTLEGHGNGINSVAFSPDGETLAAGGRSNAVRLWRVADGLLLRELNGHTNDVCSVSFSPDGKTLASVAYDDTVRLWRVSDGVPLHTLKGYKVDSVAFSPARPESGPGEATLASGRNGGIVQLWRVSDGVLLRELEEHSSRVYVVPSWIKSVAFSPALPGGITDGEMLVSGANDYTVRLWRVSDGALLRTFEGHTSGVNSVAFSPDGNMVASGSDDKTVRLWRVSDGALLHTLEGHTASVNSVAFSPDGETLASGSHDKAVRLWRVSDGALLRTLEGHTYGVYSVAFSPDGKTLASADHGTVRLWRVSDGMLVRALEGHTSGASSVAFSPDGKLLASGDYDTVRLWRVSDGMLLRTLKGHTTIVRSVAFSPDGKWLASGSEDGTIRLWGVR